MTVLSVKSVLSAAAGVLAVTAMGSAGPAAADPPTASAADVVVQHLKDEGYSVSFNMPSNMALSRCTVSGIDGLNATMSSDGNIMMMMGPDSRNTTVYVTLNCPDSNN